MPNLIHLSPKESYDFLQRKPEASFIDIRSSMEYLFVGHPKGAIHIAWIDEPDWEINPDFAKEVTKAVEKKAKGDPKEMPVVLICRSGVRTLEAAAVLHAAGFTNVTHVVEGFEGDRDEDFHRSTLGGWRFHGLPWEQC